MADGSGISIQKENFKIVSEDGKNNVIAWTLANYLETSHIKYPSRTRLYCVKMLKGTKAHLYMIVFCTNFQKMLRWRMKVHKRLMSAMQKVKFDARSRMCIYNI